MSRCFPYPPPGHLRHGLIESIKLERGNVLPKSEQKINKKEKKEKKEKRKESKAKERTHGISKKLKKLDDILNVYNDEQLEKSDITEEHDPPVCYISDRTENSTQNSGKRKRETVPSSQCTVNGNIIKIRFSLGKPEKPDVSLRNEPVCSTSEREECSAQSKAQEQCYPLNKRAKTVTPVPEQKQWLDDDGTQQIPSSSGTSAYHNEMQKAVLQYKALVEDWVQPSLQYLNDADDNEDDWLFVPKQQGKPATAKISKVDNDVTCRASSTSFSQAYFLPEAEIYALPYTVPF